MLGTGFGERGAPGRPRRRYRLTAAADALFPKAYGELTTELLDHVGAEGYEVRPLRATAAA